jgi:alpha-mannosidase
VNTYIFHLIAHTHWDREWFLPRAAFHARLIPMLDELIERLHNDTALRSFLLDGQTVLVEDYLRARPERETDVKALVKTGRLQVGPWYVLADELIPSGESLIRNLLLGGADAERLGGRLDVLYSPDAFGHPAMLPAVAREFGIKFACLWRGLGGEPGQERDSFRWRAPDGQEVLLWHFPPAGYEIGVALPGAGARLPEVWADVRAALVERAAGKHIPVFIGADHHAPHPHLVGLRDLLAELEPASAFRISRLDEFFQAAEATPARLISGELRWSYGYTWTLQGVHGTRSPLKRRHGNVELALERIAEPLAALARIRGGRDRRPVLETAWRTLVRAQFHDTIAGTTADEVAIAAEGRQTSVASYAGEIARSAVLDLAGHDPDSARERSLPNPSSVTAALLLWNPAARPRGGVTVADVTFFRRDVLVGPPGDRQPQEGPGYRPFALYLAGGNGIPVQVLAQRVTQERLDAVRHYPDQDEVDQVRIAFRAPSVAGLGLASLTRGAPVAAAKGDDVRSRGRTLENRLVAVTLEPSGALSLADKRQRVQYAGLLRLEDTGDAGDAYTFCSPARDRLIRSTGPIAVRRLATGPLVAALEARWTLTRGIDVRMVTQVYADSPIVRVILEIDNQNVNHRLRARLPTGLDEAPVIAGSAFGIAQRAALSVDFFPGAYAPETPVRTAPAQRFVAAAAATRGLALLAPAFLEYEWTSDGDLLVTLLRSIGELSRGDLSTRPGHAAWPTSIPGAQCIGRSRVELAFAPIAADDVDRGDALPQMWEEAFLPLHGVWLRDAGRLTLAPVDITLEGKGLVLSSVKPAQVGSPIVLRCYNATAHKVTGAWRFGDGIKTAHRVRADEREATALALDERGRIVRFVAEPHEIVSILVT